MNNEVSLAFLKASIIVEGINYNNISFEKKNEELYKFKTKTKKPVSHNYKVYDVSNCDEIVPSEIKIFYKNNMCLVKSQNNTNSNIVAMYKNNEYVLYFKELDLYIKMDLVELPKVLSEPIDIYGVQYKISDFISVVGYDRISILLFDGCWNWNIGNPCKFCDMHPRRENFQCIIPSTNDIIKYNLNLTSWWNNNKSILLIGIKKSIKLLKECGEIGPHFHLIFISGALSDNKITWKIFNEILSVIEEDVKGLEIIVNLQPHSDTDDLYLIKQLNVSLQYNIEVFGEENYSYCCPEKISYFQLLSKLDEAVSVLGHGKVRSNFVLGLQTISETLIGAEMLANRGIIPDYSIFQPKLGTEFEKKEKPSVNDVIRISKHLSSIYKRYDYKPIYCNMSSRSSVMCEMFL